MRPSLDDAAISAFLPSKDFELSKRFYEALGFEKTFDGEVAGFRTGDGSFVLTRLSMPQWDGAFAMACMVDDLDAWWAHIESLDLPGAFGITWTPRPPAMQPWGLRVAYVCDPGGVLWHFQERLKGG
jgi:hypothetical protein